MVIYSWNTKKSNSGYKYRVEKITPRKTPNKFGQYANTIIIKSGTQKTRARAKGMATRWVRYYNQKK